MSKGKVEMEKVTHPRTGHEGPEWEQMCSFSLPSTSALDGGGWSTSRPGTHCTGGWVGNSAGLEGCGKPRPHRDSIPVPSSP
jgi:hypothetical protein